MQIHPTVGRVVLFHTTNYDQPLSAMISWVNDDGTINVNVQWPGIPDKRGITIHGTTTVQAVPLIQPGQSPVPYDPYCTWMDYQIGQAAKTEQAQSELEKAKAGICVMCGKSSVGPGQPHCQACSDKIREENKAEYLARAAEAQKGVA